MKLTDVESNQLQKEIDHILDSGANSMRLLEMFNNFLMSRKTIINTIFCTCNKPWSISRFGVPTCCVCDKPIKLL